MNKATAAELRALATKYGDRNDVSEDVYLVIQVVGSAGVPVDTYAYVSRPVFLNLDPAYLAVATASTLMPTIITVRAEFTGGSSACKEIGTDETSVVPDADEESGRVIPEFSARRAQVHALLKRALTPGGQSDLKGSLVRFGSGAVNGHFHQYFEMDRNVEVDSDGGVTITSVEAASRPEASGEDPEVSTTSLLTTLR